MPTQSERKANFRARRQYDIDIYIVDLGSLTTRNNFWSRIIPYGSRIFANQIIICNLRKIVLSQSTSLHANCTLV